MFDKIFNWVKKKDSAANQPAIPFGRYSDNNKKTSKVDKWTRAEALHKEKKYTEAIATFFDYLKDDQTGNVSYTQTGDNISFELHQGSKVVRGTVTDGQLSAAVKLARMPQPSVPVMRRLLEQNFMLYYTRYALDQEQLCMRFDSQLEMANPSKLYYGLKELATKSDKQDDLLMQDFSGLEPVDNEHIMPIDEKEKQVKYDYLQAWIKEALEKIESVDADKFSGGIAYLLLTLLYRIDFLISPEGQTLNELEKISFIYFKKDEKQTVEKNRDMIVELKKLQAKPREDFFKDLFRSKYTFSVVAPQVHKTMADAVKEANDNMLWYRDNDHHYFANKIMEYGLSFCQFSYSLPKPITDFFTLFMQVNYPAYFRDLGFTRILYNEGTKQFNKDEIAAQIRRVQQEWKDRFPMMYFNPDRLNYQNGLVAFNHSFAMQIEQLNMDVNR